MITLQDLDDTVQQIDKLVDELRNKLYPNGKPDWMPQEKWNEIIGKDGEKC